MIYLRIAEQLKNRINSGEFSLQHPLPSEHQLASVYQVSRMTLRRAIDCLVDESLVERRHGSGNFVVGKEVIHENKGLHSLSEQAQKSQKSLSSQVITFTMMSAPASIARHLKIPYGESVYYIVRVRYLGEWAIHYEESYLPVKLYPTLSIAHMEQSKFAYIEHEAGFVIEGNSFTFQPILTPTTIAQYLQVNEGTPLLQITSISHAPDGTILDFSMTVENIQHHQSTYFFRRMK
ncbi:MAG: Mannosyl-D-glycerate transport/metabolism system repressor MngR [Candidatus Celerinatantimonas neptuna]|nr:MAG: Mannosyl-D-glycerate transport/metabolism system repressor MngR [Candidatus Celerinatantimonas neptuna]